jgi:hypothetical protein
MIGFVSGHTYFDTSQTFGKTSTSRKGYVYFMLIVVCFLINPLLLQHRLPQLQPVAATTAHHCHCSCHDFSLAL